MSFVLASGSPRRRQFLEELGYSFTVSPANIDETLLPGEDASSYAGRLARTKASAVARGLAGQLVLGADTVIVAGGVVLGKPENEADFRRMMGLLSGKTHEVITAVAVRSDAGLQDEIAVRTAVVFRELSNRDIAWYWGTGEPHDKAGGYALQGRGGAFITGIAGSHSNVIGLPIVETVALLERAGVAPPWRQR